MRKQVTYVFVARFPCVVVLRNTRVQAISPGKFEIPDKPNANADETFVLMIAFELGKLNPRCF